MSSRPIANQMLRLLNPIHSLISILADARATSKQNLHLSFYNKTPNVGDDLNLILATSLQDRYVYVPKSRCFSHILGIGSILHFATQKSIVWGSGFISGTLLPKTDVLSSMRIAALRGEKTKEVLFPLNSFARNCPLGDPGILMPEIFAPTNVAKKYKLGIVPHYVDCESPIIKSFEGLKDVSIIKPFQNPFEFIKNIMACDYIASSSLHGLILSDAYSIPNVRLKISDRVIGGDFKFDDYYSTTSGFGMVSAIDLRDHVAINLKDIFSLVISNASVSTYLYSKENLLLAFRHACSLV